MSKLIGVVFLIIMVIILLPAVLGGMALNTFGTILVGILGLLGLIFLK